MYCVYSVWRILLAGVVIRRRGYSLFVRNKRVRCSLLVIIKGWTHVVIVQSIMLLLLLCIVQMLKMFVKTSNSGLKVLRYTVKFYFSSFNTDHIRFKSLMQFLFNNRQHLVCRIYVLWSSLFVLISRIRHAEDIPTKTPSRFLLLFLKCSIFLIYMYN